uniref:LIM zinc-binding domain-containing protein n=1 Tax=Stomoxys calcitrans TaxID=35570 RepID=A0A1I8PXH8_STOCA
MAAYEVPDRLSILTYLSQYYQAFAAQNSHNRLKRPSSSATEKTQISKPTGPPPKMAHVVGVPRRDPCRKCQLPVFLAERLLVGKKVYHRTCLKCARCGSQLTPGSFYETEVDDQYCCETCPDEEITATNVDGGGDVAAASSVPPPSPPTAEISTEVQLRSKLDGDVSPTITRSVRSSIRDRLAFFEQKQQQTTEKQREGSAESDSKLLQKSLSDEEKSKSLQRMENNSSAMATTSYKMNSALSNFLNDTVDNEPEDQNQAEEDEESLESLTSSAQNSKMDTDSEETDDLTSVSLPPELPKSLPPLVVEQESADEKQKKEEKEEAKRFTASAQLILGGNSTTDSSHLKADEEENIIRSRSQSRSPTNSTGRQTSELKISLRSSLKSHDKTNNNTELEDNDDKAKTIAAQQMTPQPNLTSQMTETIQQIELENNLACNETNDNDCVTKDKAKVNDSMMAMETEIEAAQQLESTTTTTTTALEEVNSTKPAGEKIETSDKSNEETENEVELRTKSSLKDNHNTLHASSPGVEDKETTQRLSVVRARLQQFEVITNNEKAKESSPISAATKAKENLNISTPPKTPIAPMPIITTTAPTTPPMELKEDESLSRSREDEQMCATSITQKDPNEDTTMVQMDDDTNTETVTESLEKPPNEKPIQEVPLVMETKDNELLEDKHKSIEKEEAKEEEEEEKESAKVEPKVSPPSSSPLRNSSTPNKPPLEEYPEDLNPFKSDDEDEPNEENKENVVLRKPPIPKQPAKVISCNPFDSSDDEIELDKSQNSTISTPKIPPPRPPPPRISRNPFGSEDEDEDLSKASQLRRSSLTASQSKRTPVPTPRTNVSSNNSLNLSAGGTIRSRKSRRAPLPPAPVKELFPSSETLNTSSKASTPSSSTVGTPKSGRKKRPAPAPPKPARLDPSTAIPQIQAPESLNLNTQSKNLLSYPLQSELDSKLSDEEKALLEGKTNAAGLAVLCQDEGSRRNSKRLIPLDKELLEEHANESQCDDLKHQQQHLQKSHHHVQESEPNVVYRRLLIPHNLDTPTHESNPLLDELNNSSMLGERQLEKLKDNKEANNRNRQSQISAASSGNEDNDPLFNKSVHGKWKRRKGPAPALPIPPRRVLQMLPLQEIKHELDIIEVQQQGLEKQGVILEKMIRDRCEGENGEPLNAAGEIPPTLDGTSGGVGHQSPALENSKEVENLILQLFELVNEKNELFRRQAELMYLRRQHRLEQEQADLEYEIRVLMAQPERNKTDSDKAREEAFIERLIEVVQLRNEVVECLEMDRIREAEEDQSIKQRLESHIANKRDDEPETKKSSTSKLSKKEKKKQKESKKLAKNKKLDADKTPLDSCGKYLSAEVLDEAIL